MSLEAGSLDTNVVLRLLLNDVPEQHSRAVNLLRESTGTFQIADTAIIEVVFVLCRAYDFTRLQAAKAVEEIMNRPELDCNEVLFAKAVPLFINHPALSFEDCYLSVYAELHAALPLWTFDKKLAGQVSNAKLIAPAL